MFNLRRREFITLLGAIAFPRGALGQVTSRRPLVAWLGFGAQDDFLSKRNVGRLIAGMRELRYTEGRDFEMVYRYADYHADRLPSLAAELVQLNPDVIVAQATIDGLAACRR